MKIIFLTDNFPPESNAPAIRTYEHINYWIKDKNIEITIITCFPNFPYGKVFPNYKNKLFEVDYVNGIKVIRVWSFISKNEGLFKRTIDFISFSITSIIAGIFEKGDIIIATSPQFFTSFSAYFLSKIKNIPWIFEVRDLWPESIGALNAISNKNILKVLEKCEIFLYQNCKRIITVTNSFKKDIYLRGINKEKISVVENGVNLNNFTFTNKKRTSQIIKDKFVIGYFGTIGMAHGMEFIVKSIPLINIEKVHFLIIGNGSNFSEIKKLSEKLSIKNLTILNAIPREKLIEYYQEIDVSLVNLKKSVAFKKVIPSKIFKATACQKPILLGVEGESKKILESYRAGICFKPENLSSLKKAIKEIMKPENYNSAKNGCYLLAKKYSRERLAKKMLTIIKKTKLK